MSIHVSYSLYGSMVYLSSSLAESKPYLNASSSDTLNPPSVTVTLSDEARQLASVEPPIVSAEIAARGTNAFIKSDTDLRELLKQYDFRNITPRQMTHLGNELLARGEISWEANINFSVANNLATPMDQDKPIDLIAHFQTMNEGVERAARSDSGYDYAIANRKHASQTFEDIMSFVESDRTEISTHQGVSVRDLDEIRQQQHLEAALVLLKHPPKFIFSI